MPGRFKPGLDWTAIRECWEAGQSARSLATRFPVTRQGIEYRAKQEEWTRTPQAEAIAATGTLQRAEQPKTARDRALLALDAKRTPAAMQKILDALREGATRRLAARMARVPESSLRDWLEADVEFAALADAAEAEFASGAVTRIRKAGERGEWRADLALLERHPATRDDFAPQPEWHGVGNIAVQVVLPPDLAAILDVPATKRIIDHDPTRAGGAVILDNDDDGHEGSTGGPQIGGSDRG